MEYFYSEGGNNKPYFIYRFTVQKVTTEMFEWCQKYPEKGPFSRFHVIFDNEFEEGDRSGDRKKTAIIQFELRDAYLAFQYAFAGEILEDRTMKEYK